VLGRPELYVVHEDMLPDETVLGCGPALNANVQEDLDFINLCPVLAVEACELDCATKLVDKKQQKATRTIRIPDLVKELKLDLDALPEEHIDTADPVVQAVAKRIAEDVKELLSSELLASS
jgi:uncharacterized metal-binding protein